jgi:hypothetical protein
VSVGVLAEAGDVLVDLAAGVLLVIALAVLARTAMRSAADGAQRDVEPPRPRS